MGKVINRAQGIGIVYPCVAKISGVNNIDTDKMMEFDNLIEEKYNQICLDFEQIIKEPQVAGYKEILEKLGYMDTTPAGMRLLTSFKEKGFKHINYLVDAYNIVSMQYCAGIGMHDAELLGDVIEIGVADGTETIRPMFQAKEKKIKKGDLIYTSNGATVAWLGKKDVDSDDFKVTESTTDIVLVVLGNLHTDSEYSRCIAREIYEMIKLCSREAEIDFYEII